MIAEAIMYKYPNTDPTKDFIVQNDGEGSYIAEWNLRAPIPTQKELESWWEELQKTHRMSRLIRWSFSLRNCPKKSWLVSS